MHVRSWRRLALALPLVSTLAGAIPTAAGADSEDVFGTYRMQGRFSVHARPFPAQADVLHVDAVLAPSASQGEARMRLAGQGARCELTVTLDSAGALTVPAGQRCQIDLASDRAEGRTEARVLSGSGRIRDDVLHLELELAVTGSVRLRSASGSIGKVLSLPGSREPITFEGEAWGRAEGRRDRSRAGQ